MFWEVVMVHKSKVDKWIAAVLLGVPVLMLLFTIIEFIGARFTSGLILLGTFAFIFVIYLLVVYPVHYETKAEILVIRFGIIRYKIPYADIVSVRPTRNILSSPALSLDRLKIEHGKSMPTLISPIDKRLFLEDLASHAPQLKLIRASLVSG